MFHWIVTIFILVIVLPTAAYLCVKWGATGYYRARQRERDKENRKQL
jgi:hypothetical protein